MIEMAPVRWAPTGEPPARAKKALVDQSGERSSLEDVRYGKWMRDEAGASGTLSKGRSPETAKHHPISRYVGKKLTA